MVGYLWAFKEDWNVNGSQFCLTWMTLWLFMDINFLLFDAAATVVPMSGMPFIVFTWIIINVTSTVTPLELNPGFYRWSYALPGYEAYTVLQGIWTKGAVPQLYHALPILFSWWVVGWAAASFGHLRRCPMAKMEAVDRDLVDPDIEKSSEEAPTAVQLSNERSVAVTERETSASPSEEPLSECLEELPTLEDMRIRSKSAASVQ